MMQAAANIEGAAVLTHYATSCIDAGSGDKSRGIINPGKDGVPSLPRPKARSGSSIFMEAKYQEYALVADRLPRQESAPSDRRIRL